MKYSISYIDLSNALQALSRQTKDAEGVLEDITTDYRQSGRALLVRLQARHQSEYEEFSRLADKQRQYYVAACQNAVRETRALEDRFNKTVNMEEIVAANTERNQGTLAGINELQAKLRDEVPKV